MHSESKGKAFIRNRMQSLCAEAAEKAWQRPDPFPNSFPLCNFPSRRTALRKRPLHVNSQKARGEDRTFEQTCIHSMINEVDYDSMPNVERVQSPLAVFLAVRK